TFGRKHVEAARAVASVLLASRGPLVLREARLDLPRPVHEHGRVEAREVNLAAAERRPERELALLLPHERFDVLRLQLLALERRVARRQRQAMERCHHDERLAGALAAHPPLAPEAIADDALPAHLDGGIAFLGSQSEGCGIDAAGDEDEERHQCRKTE